MTPSGPTTGGGLRRAANAVEGARSASPTKSAQDRIRLVSIFTLTVELRPCWQGLARCVNDTRGSQVRLPGRRRGRGVEGDRSWRNAGACALSHKIQSRRKLDELTP